MRGVDEVDMKILQMLAHDSRTTFGQMSKLLDLSEAGIRKRVKALEDREIIKRFTIEIDPSKIGINNIAFVGVDVDPSKMLEAIEKLCGFPEVRNLASSTGEHMIMMEVWTEDGKELSKFVSQKVSKIEGVKRVCPAILMEKYKE